MKHKRKPPLVVIMPIATGPACFFVFIISIGQKRAKGQKVKQIIFFGEIR
jgi:hypothetical protein